MINTGIDVNVVNLTGNLMCDVTWKEDKKGNRTIGFFAVGTARCINEEDKIYVTDRHSIVVKNPAVISKFPEVAKGSRVSIQGVLMYRRYENCKHPEAEIRLETIKAL